MSIENDLKAADPMRVDLVARSFGSRNILGAPAMPNFEDMNARETFNTAIMFDAIRPRDWFWPNFTPEEIACKGTGLVPIKSTAFIETMDALQALRTEMQKPFFVTSMYRSPKYNKHVGGAAKSQHPLARAVDISTFNLDRAQLVQAAKRLGFRGVGYYKTFIHLDTRKRAATWGKP